jgi:CO/xanthine dehydrogenase Mo-binding subunit
MDKVAKAVGLAPDEFRRGNFIHEGETTATDQIIRERVDMNGLLDRAFEISDYHKKRERFARENDQSTVKRGIGFASSYAWRWFYWFRRGLFAIGSQSRSYC